MSTSVAFAGAETGAPIPVSPGAAEHELAIAAACPTFSWSQASGVTGYRLSVFELSEQGWISETPALAVELPGGVGSWTLGADGCLEAGRRYAWQVEGLGGRERGEVPAPLVFEVRETAQEASRVDALLRDLAAHLGVEVEQLRRRLTGEAVPPDEEPPRLRAVIDAGVVESRPREVAATTVVGFSGSFSGRVHAQSGGGWWADLAGPGIGGTGPTGVTGWGQTGMFGYGDVTGVWGETGVPSGVGVRGNAWGGGTGVIGYGGGASHGVFGESVSGSGIYGTVVTATSSNAGVKGVSTNATGVRGESSAKAGVHGVGSPGVYGESGDNGVEGVSTGSYFGASGVKGVANNGFGVQGRSANGTAVYGFSDYGVGVVGSAGDIGGYFTGGDYGVFIDLDSGCYGCAKKLADRASVATREASPRLPARALLATASGAFLSSGGNWVNASDERVKENFAEVDGEDLLARVDRLPIRTWNYIADGPAARHIGPTAQDFQAAFELGGGDTAISTVDPAGIALAAIQALYRENQQQRRAAQEQQRAIDELRSRLATFESERASASCSSVDSP